MKLSVIVCTRNRAHALADCLNSIAAALSAAAPVDAEIVVVDNASTDNTGDTVRQWAQTCPFPIQALTEPRKGLSKARNCGLRAARGELLAFTDDDCRMRGDYVQALLRHDENDAQPVLRGGRVELGDPTDQPFGIRTGTTARRWQKSTRSDIGSLSGALMGANMAMRKTLVDQVGFFDERFGAGGQFKGGEEIDYLYRAYLQDIPIEYAPDMVIYHFHGRKSPESIRELVNGYDIGDGALYAKFLFRDITLLRPLWWDMKKAMKELFGGPLARPALGLSHRERVIHVLQGMLQFSLSLWERAGVRVPATYSALTRFPKIRKEANLRKPPLPQGEGKSQKMNILFLTAHKYLPQMHGGLQHSTDEICHSLIARGHRVAVFAGLMPGGWFGFISRLKIKLNTLVTGHPVTRDNALGYPVWRSWHPANDVAYVTEKTKPDLIVVMAVEPVRMGLAAQRTGVPLLMKLMDVEFGKHGGDFKALGAVACMANSHFTADSYRNAYGVAPSVIYPYIDPKKYQTPTTRENVTFINPVAEKGLDIALETARLCPDIPFAFVEGWPLTPVQRGQLQQNLAKLPNVTLLPPQPDMRAVYGKCNILLAPSHWEEAYGRVATEAQMSGIPVVASSRGGLPEAVGPGGILLPHDAPAAQWAAAIRSLWNNENEYRRLSQAAKRHAARDELQYDALLDTTERVFREAAASPLPLGEREVSLGSRLRES